MSARSMLPAIRACLFDMDSLLLNTEDLITKSINQILTDFEKPILPWDIKLRLQGRTLQEATRIFLDWSKLPLSPQEYQDRLRGLHEALFPTAELLAGVAALIEGLQRTPTTPLALVTSSSPEKFRLKTSHLTSFFSAFPPEHRVLAGDARIKPGRGKPEGDVYILALNTLNERMQRENREAIKPEECLVFEDALAGVEAGRKAGMQVAWCPHADLLSHFQGREKEFLDTELEVSKGDVRRALHGEPNARRTGDLWVQLFRSLEEFDPCLYHIEL